MIIDIHTHIGEDKDGSSQTISELKESMALNKINKSIVFPFDERNKSKLAASLDLLKEKDDSIIPMLRINPKQIDATTIKKLIKKFCGVKLHPRSENFDPLDNMLWPIYNAISDSGKPVLIHTRKENNKNTDPCTVALVAKLYPRLNVILAHFAAASPEALELVKTYGNLYIDTSVISSPRLIEIAVEKVGSDKILYGSDAPYSDQEIELLKIKKARISDLDKENILYKNAKRLLGW